MNEIKNISIVGAGFTGKQIATITALYEYHVTIIDLNSEMLKEAKITVPVEIETIMLKYSYDMTKRDRETIVKKIQQCKFDRIIISHGTDKMTETAQLLGKNIQDKIVVLFGAMTPFAFRNSDALFNLGTALIAVQKVPKGVYIAMNGKVFTWDNVQKDQKKGIFENIK